MRAVGGGARWARITEADTYTDTDMDTDTCCGVRRFGAPRIAPRPDRTPPIAETAAPLRMYRARALRPTRHSNRAGARPEVDHAVGELLFGGASIRHSSSLPGAVHHVHLRYGCRPRELPEALPRLRTVVRGVDATATNTAHIFGSAAATCTATSRKPSRPSAPAAALVPGTPANR